MEQEKKMKMKVRGIAFAVFGFVLALALFIPLTGFAQLTVDQNLASTFGLGDADLLETVINVVRWALGIVGLIAVIYMMYGGFLWMTARGNEEQVRKAKRVITQAAIGLVIILLAFAIVQFIIGVIGDSTNGSGTGPCTDGQQIGYPSCRVCSGGSWVSDPSPSDPQCTPSGPSYYVRWTLPEDLQTDVSLCSIAAAGFDGVTPPWLDGGTVNSSTVTIIDENGVNVATTGAYTVNPDSNAFRYRHNTEWQANHLYTVQVTNGVQSVVGSVPATAYSWQFETGTTSDPNPPQVTLAEPSGPGQCLAPRLRVVFNEPMDPVSVNRDNVTLSPADATVTGVQSLSSSEFIIKLSNPLQGNTTYTVTLNADLTNGIMDACGNALDGDSDGTAEGSPTDDYSWTFTTEDTTEVDCAPEIDSVSSFGQYSYDAGDVITISGKQLSTVDSVFFKNKYFNRDIQVDNIAGANSKCFNTDAKPQQSSPQSIACVQNRTANSIDVVVPAGGIDLGDPGNGATDGAIRVRSIDEFSNTNDDLQDVGSPHIRSISPSLGGEGQYVTIRGDNFTADGAVWLRRADGTEIQAQTCDTSAWSNNQIVIKIPPGFSAGDEVLLQVDADTTNPNNGTDRSNVRTFLITNDEPTPGICTIAPTCHNTGSQQVTLTGEGFGNNAGRAYFAATENNVPNIWSSSTFSPWTNTQVRVSTPGNLPNDIFQLYLESSDGRLSNSVTYEVPCGQGPEVIFNGGTCNPGAGQTPSPNPYADADNVCPNLDRIAFAFTQSVTRPTPGEHTLFRCNSGRGSCDTDSTEIGTSNTIGPATGIDFYTETFADPQAASGNTLRADTWYKFVINGTVRSNISGITIGEDVEWFFKTRADATPCDADSAEIDFVSATRNFNPVTNVSDGNNTITYEGILTNDATCNVINPPAASYAWTTDTATLATCSGGCTSDSAQILTSNSNEGSTQVRFSYLGTVNANRPLTVRQNFCDVGIPCTTTDGGGNTCTATCNTTEQRCEPHITSLSASSGAEGSGLTVNGCYFGTTAGAVNFFDDTNANDILDTGETNIPGDLSICGPIAQWSSKQIVVGVPAGHPDGTVTDVQVQANYSGTPVVSDNTQSFTYTNACSNGASIPPGGVPVLCSISPTAGAIGDSVLFRGIKFFNGETVEFTGATAAQTDTIWTEPTRVSTQVPSGFVTGPAWVEINNGSGGLCPSNSLLFAERCSSNGECATGCCQSNICVPAGNCSTGNVIGEACEIENAFYASDNTCNTGLSAPRTIDGLSYRCLSDTGYNEDPGKTGPVSPSGTQCEYCCDPDEDGDPGTFDPQISGELTCVEVPGGSGSVCESTGGTGRGLFCGCDPAQETTQCGINNGCSTQNDPTGDACCRPRPSVVSVSASNGAASLACTNESIRIRFSEPMDRTSITNSTILVTVGGSPVQGSFHLSGDDVYFNPSGQWTPGATISITIRGTTSSIPHVKNRYGITLGSDYTSAGLSVRANATLCQIDDIEFFWEENGSGLLNPPSLFTCARNDCTEDYDGASAGNQQLWIGQPIDASGRYISGSDISFEEFDSKDVFSGLSSCPSGLPAFFCNLTSTGNNGRGVFRVTADGSGSGIGTVSKSAVINAFMCDSPWPPNNYPNFPFEDTNYNFSMHFCRDGLPTLWFGQTQDTENGTLVAGPTSPLLRTFTPSDPNVDELLREYVFFVTDDAGVRIGSDAVGIRIMENSLHLPPDLWYRRARGTNPTGSSLTTINGFPAMRLGRSVYIAGTNVIPNGATGCSGPGTGCNGGVMYSNMYIFSFDGDSSQTEAIFGKLMNNLALTINVGDSVPGTTEEDAEKIRDDARRIQDIFRVSLLLSDYRKTRGDYPSLASGTFLQNSSTSAWPSWQQTLGQALGVALPTDPINEIVNCPLGDDNSACWDEQSRVFTAPDGSHLYQYLYPGVNQAFLLTRLDYLGPGAWYTSATNYDPCSIYPSSACATYNYSTNNTEFEGRIGQYQIAGSSDTTDPVINGFTIPGTITQSELISISATDTESGNGRAEFYVNGTLRYIDYTNDFEWQFNPASYADGNYQFEIRVFDNAGNAATTGPQNVTIQKSVTDQEPPQISNFVPADNTTHTGTISMSVNTSDGGSGIERVEYYIGTGQDGIQFIGSCLSGSTCASSNYSFAWDSSTLADGTYDLYAVAFDNAGNTAIIRHTVMLNNGIDLQNPFVLIKSPRDGDKVSGTILVEAQASDNEGIAFTQLEIPANNLLASTASFPNPDSTDPYRWTWNTLRDAQNNPIPDGNMITLTVTAQDVNGRRSSDQVTVEVDNSAGPMPNAWFDVPLDGDVFSPGIFQVHAEAQAGISFVELHAIDGGGTDTLLGTTTTGNPYLFNWDTSLPDGPYTLRAIAVDSQSVSSNPSDPNANISVQIDRTPPAITSTSPASGANISGTVTVSVSATDAHGLSQVGLYSEATGHIVGQCYPAGFPNSFTCNFSWDTTTAPNGSFGVVPFAVDQANNVGSLYVPNITIENVGANDTTPPVASVDLSSDVTRNGRYYIAGNTTVNATATDNVAVTGIDVSIAGMLTDSLGQERGGAGPTCASSPCTIPWISGQNPAGAIIMDGTSVPVSVVAFDGAGNMSATASRNYIVDNSAPSMASVIDDGATTSTGTQLHATWTQAVEPHVASANDVEYFYSIGTVPGGNNTVNWTSAGLGSTFVTHTGLSLVDGTTYYINVRATNGSGLQSNVVTTDGITYTVGGSDTTPPSDPVITFNPDVPYHRGTTQITVTSSDSESGIQSIEVRIDGSVVTTCTASPCVYSWNTTTASNGPHTVSAVATNTESLPSNSTSVSTSVDNGPPSVSVSIPVPNQFIGGNFTFSATATDSPSGVSQVTFYRGSITPGNELCTDTSAASGWSCVGNTAVIPDGPVTILARATDVAGNTANSSGVQATVNNATPTLNCGTLLCGPGSSCCNAGTSTCYTPGVEYCCSGTVSPVACSGTPGCGTCSGCGGSNPPPCCLFCAEQNPGGGGGAS